ncbi:MAG: polysaccharide deacetylase family protein [candidate division KSB1 bacterium]|nr:polysaccharide deacetylase family protein [candidate division KSB1 bacterium]
MGLIVSGLWPSFSAAQTNLTSGTTSQAVRANLKAPGNDTTMGRRFTFHLGGIIRGDSTRKKLALVFTGDQFADGGELIRRALAKYQIKASFFLTGNFYRHPEFQEIIQALKQDGHYLGAHSDRHLLYCTWENRDSLLVTREQFIADLKQNYLELARFGIRHSEARFFLPPFEWYNRRISNWAQELGLTLVNFTPGTKSHTDWTYPELGPAYVPSQTILHSIMAYEQKYPSGLNGFILLLHIGSDPRRTDKFYSRLEQLLQFLDDKGYHCVRIDELLQ